MRACGLSDGPVPSRPLVAEQEGYPQRQPLPNCRPKAGALPHSGKSPRSIGEIQASSLHDSLHGGPRMILNEARGATVTSSSSSLQGGSKPARIVCHSP